MIPGTNVFCGLPFIYGQFSKIAAQAKIFDGLISSSFDAID
jgi:hypothetical protein